MARVAIMREKKTRIAARFMGVAGRHRPLQGCRRPRGAFQIKVGSEGYPPDLETLVKGVDVGGKKNALPAAYPHRSDDEVRNGAFAPCMTIPRQTPEAGRTIFDVFTKAQGTGLDGTEYKEW